MREWTREEIQAATAARARSDSYIQNHPGDGFEHAVETVPPGEKQEWLLPALIPCKCGLNIMITRIRAAQGECTIVICSGCFYWHVIHWFTSTKAKGHFILPK